MLTGLLEPSDGQIVFNGRSIRDDLVGYQRRIGYVPEEARGQDYPAQFACGTRPRRRAVLGFLARNVRT